MEERKLTENNNVKVYNETTTVEAVTPAKPAKKKRRDKSDLGENFVAPDGGWGWAVVLAAGISTFSVFPCMQQYGILYREHFKEFNFNASEITTIINTVLAVSALTGLLNGAMFRRFTFRQVSIAGAALITCGIVFSAFCTTFFQYIIFFAVVFGLGLGINMSANSLAVNTYFKNKRRTATGFSWTITGLGPIIFPHLVTFFLIEYGFQWSVFIFAAISLNALAAGMVLQPVLWHVKPLPKGETEALAADLEYECKYCQARKRKHSVIASQYLFNDDDADKPGFEITEPCTPMLSLANDGLYSSKMSLASNVNVPRKLQRHLSSVESRTTMNNEGLSRPNYFNRQREDMERYASKASIYSKYGKEEFKCTCAEEKALLQKQIDAEKEEEKQAAANLVEKPLTFMQKVVKFFDLDLLRDFTFVNLVLGITLILFGEMNFSVLTPFMLNDFGFTNNQISTAMSLIGGLDLSVRFLAPFVLEKIKLGNRMLFSIGIIAIMVGRTLVTFAKSYETMLFALTFVGLGKGLRTIFAPLIIPSYVPLNRLPAASGLQLISNGIFTLGCGPVVGMITDSTSYIVTIHFINLMTTLALCSWLAENVIRKFLSRNKERQVET